jgi:hypothetical protein
MGWASYQVTLLDHPLGVGVVGCGGDGVSGLFPLLHPLLNCEATPAYSPLTYFDSTRECSFCYFIIYSALAMSGDGFNSVYAMDAII